MSYSRKPREFETASGVILQRAYLYLQESTWDELAAQARYYNAPSIHEYVKSLVLANVPVVRGPPLAHASHR